MNACMHQCRPSLPARLSRDSVKCELWVADAYAYNPVDAETQAKLEI